MDDFQLEIAEFNKTQINELLRLLDKIKIDDIKQLYLNSPEFQTKPFSIEQNLSYLFPKINKIKETLNKALTNNYIGYNELVEIKEVIIILENFRALNPIIRGLLKFNFYNLMFDIDYILEKKINPDIDFNGIFIQQTTFIKEQTKVKNYLSNYTITPFTQKEKKEFIDFEKIKIEKDKTSGNYEFTIPPVFLLYTNKDRNENGDIINADLGRSGIYRHSFIQNVSLSAYNSQFDSYYQSKYNDIDSSIKISFITDEELLKDIAKGVKNVFKKKEKREEYSTRIKRILESKDSIDHIELYENLNEYLQLFGNKEELDKLNEKYKSQLSIQIIKNKFIEIIQILTSVLKKIDDNEELKNVIESLILTIDDRYLKIEDFIINEYIALKLLLLEDLKNLYKPNYFHINSKPPIQNLDFIIKTFKELFDFFIDYININYKPHRIYGKPPNYMQIQTGGFKKILKKYK